MVPEIQTSDLPTEYLLIIVGANTYLQLKLHIWNSGKYGIVVPCFHHPILILVLPDAFQGAKVRWIDGSVGPISFFCHVELVPSAGGNVMVGWVLICGEPIFGRGVAGVSGVGAGKYSPDPPCHADNRRLPTVCHKQTLPSLPSLVQNFYSDY